MSVIGFHVDKELDREQEPVFKITGPAKDVMDDLTWPDELPAENVTLIKVPVEYAPGLTNGTIGCAPEALNKKYPLTY